MRAVRSHFCEGSVLAVFPAVRQTTTCVPVQLCLFWNMTLYLLAIFAQALIAALYVMSFGSKHKCDCENALVLEERAKDASTEAGRTRGQTRSLRDRVQDAMNEADRLMS